jgi:hypothetical protein
VAISASPTSRAALSAPVAWRNTKPAATTSAMPRPVREIDAAVRPAWGTAGSASTGAATAGAGRFALAPGTPVAGSGVTRDEEAEPRQISAAPLAISTIGQTTASENQIPSARNVSSTLSSSNPVPIATSTARRPVGRRRRRGASPAGITSQASR